MKLKHTFIFLLLNLCIHISNGQNVGIGTTTPNHSAVLELSSNEKGILIPRLLHSERIAITSPATGLLVYQNDSIQGFYFYDGGGWQNLSSIMDSSLEDIILYQKDESEIWKINIDGTNNEKINITLPQNVVFNLGDAAFRLIKQKQRIVFQAMNTITGLRQLYWCNIDGSNVTLIVESQYLQLGSVN